MSGAANPGVTDIDDILLRNWPLPMPEPDGDKEARGRLLIVGGSRGMPGAVILAANAALRAGAGKVAIATGFSIAQLVALAIPEARVIGLPETPERGLASDTHGALDSLAKKVDAVVIGPGMQDAQAACALVASLLPHFPDAGVVLDACAMDAVRNPDLSRHCRARPQLLLTPHAGEMAHLTGRAKNEIQEEPATAAQQAAEKWQALVALKGAITHLAAPDGRLWRHQGGNVGLAVSGSGDTLAGIIGGLIARGAPLEQACAWGVALHARAGMKLAQQLGPLGYLAREIPDQIPSLMHALSA